MLNAIYNLINLKKMNAYVKQNYGITRSPVFNPELNKVFLLK